MSHFKPAIALCGLSQKQAAELLGLSRYTVASYSQGRLEPPLSVWITLNKLRAQIEHVVVDGVDAADDPHDETAELNYQEELANLPDPMQRVAKTRVYMAIVGRTNR